MEASAALLAEQHARFIRNPENSLVVTQTDDGPVCSVNDEEIPLMDMAFDARVVQPGHVAADKRLKDVKGKVIILLDSEQPAAEAADVLHLMPVTIVNFGYRCFDQYNPGGKEESGGLLCWSVDGLAPSQRVPAPFSDRCAEAVLRNGEYARQVICTKAQWQGDEKPECRQVVTLGFFDLDRKIPLRMQLHGTAFGAWTALQRAYRQLRNVARLKRKSINDYIIRLEVEDKGQYYVPVFRLIEAPEEYGAPADWLPVCKHYMATVFSRPEREPEGGAPVMADMGGATEGAVDAAAVAGAQEFDL